MTRRMWVFWGLAVFLGVAYMARPAMAQRVMHRVRFGETLATLSTYYYGTDKYADVLALANNITNKRAFQPGDILRIPTAWTYTVRKTTTLKRLATYLLGDIRRYSELAIFNNLKRKRRLRAGTKVLIPCHLVYSVNPGDTFVDISRRFFGDRDHAKLIAAYNFIKSPKPSPNTNLIVPMENLKIQPLRLERLVAERLLGVNTQDNKESRLGLQEANALLRRGEYLEVPLRLVKLLARNQGSDEIMADVFTLLAVAYVAVSREDLAIKAFQEALHHLPALTLDQITTSPKVLRAFLDAKSKLQR